MATRAVCTLCDACAMLLSAVRSNVHKGTACNKHSPLRHLFRCLHELVDVHSVVLECLLHRCEQRILVFNFSPQPCQLLVRATGGCGGEHKRMLAVCARFVQCKGPTSTELSHAHALARSTHEYESLEITRRNGTAAQHIGGIHLAFWAGRPGVVTIQCMTSSCVVVCIVNMLIAHRKLNQHSHLHRATSRQRSREDG
jgi:hypothetical protein